MKASVALSSMEAEYMAASAATQEALLVNMGILTQCKLSNRERESAYKCITDG